MRDGVWRVDVEVGRDPVTGQRRRVARVVHGAREDAEIALARLKVADHEKRLPSGGTNARSVRAAFQLYLQAVDSGLIELAPATVVTSRSAAKRMCSTELADGRTFGDIRLSRLTWSDIESLYAAMRAGGNGPAWVRRCATVLTRALELARKRGLIDANPSKDAARPRTVRSKPFAPTAAEVRELLAAAAKRDAEATDAAVLLASTGARKGELLAIRWADVDLEGAEVHISAAISDGGRGVGVVRKPTKRIRLAGCPAHLRRRRGAPAASGTAERSDRRPAGQFGVRLPRWYRRIGADAAGFVEQSLGGSPGSLRAQAPAPSPLRGDGNARRRRVLPHGRRHPRQQ